MEVSIAEGIVRQPQEDTSKYQLVCKWSLGAFWHHRQSQMNAIGENPMLLLTFKQFEATCAEKFSNSNELCIKSPIQSVHRKFYLNCWGRGIESIIARRQTIFSNVETHYFKNVLHFICSMFCFFCPDKSLVFVLMPPFQTTHQQNSNQSPATINPQAINN